MPTLTKVLTRNQTRTMVPVTRRGDTWYIAGDKGVTYATKRGQYGTITCTCPAYEYRHMPFMEDCKHGRIARPLIEESEKWLSA